ncbi:MAG TPA: hypothetical protein VMG12_37450 [Polyangiaceae bacterium]|nr:hypothetical protein [Polyangiaceae bacterium]
MKRSPRSGVASHRLEPVRDGGSRFARAGAALGLSALGLTACVEPDMDPYLDDSARPIPGVVELGIDRGGAVQLEPGEGIAVAVQYGEGGAWEVATACDTARSGVRCDFDILVSTDESATIDFFDGQNLESTDVVDAPDAYAVSAVLDTGDDTDGFSFTTSPGATVRVSALLYDPSFDSWFEWSDDPRFINWVGDGAVHQGAPTNPVDLTPDRP